MPKSKNWLDKSNSKDMLPGDAVYELFSEEHKAELLNWSDNGYAVLRTFFSENQINKVNTDAANFFEKKNADWKDGKKIVAAHKKVSSIKDLAENGPLKQICQMLLGQDLNLNKAFLLLEGSDIKTTSESIHTSTYPEGNTIAAWVALEDIALNQGPLHFFPKSHTVQNILNFEKSVQDHGRFAGKALNKVYENRTELLIKEEHLRKEIFLAKKGDVFIWHSNLLYGEEPKLNGALSRKSMVFHYYSTSAICFHESTQRPSFMGG